MKLILVASILFLGFPRAAVAQENVTVAQAKARINRHLAHIDARRQAMIDTYYNYNNAAAKTLEKALKENGITFSLMYARSWAELGIGLTWSESAQQFYDYHRDVLNQSLGAIEQRGYARPDELAYLDAGMQRWDEGDRYIETQFQARVSAFVAQAKVLDEKNDYQKKYSDTLRQLQKRTPYPSDEISALQSRYDRDVKAFDGRVKQIESEDQSRSNIETAAAKHLFGPLKKAPGNLPPVAGPVGGESAVIHKPDTSDKPERTDPNTQDDNGLPPPPLPDFIRKRCEATHPDVIKQLDADKKALSDLLDQIHRLTLAAVTARRQQGQYEDQARMAESTAATAEKRGDTQTAAKAREDAAKKRRDAESKKTEAESATQNADDLGRQAKERDARVRELTSQVLKECR